MLTLYIHYSHPVYTLYSPVYTLFSPRIYIMLTLYIHYAHTVYRLCSPCIYIMLSLYIHYAHPVYTLCSHCIYIMLTLYIHYAHPVYTLCSPCSFPKIRRLTGRLQSSTRGNQTRVYLSPSATCQPLGYDDLVRVLTQPLICLSATVARGCRDRIPVRARFSAPIQTGPGANPAYYTTRTGYFPGVKRSGRGVDQPP
jgi:hypothetical protein